MSTDDSRRTPNERRLVRELEALLTERLHGWGVRAMPDSAKNLDSSLILEAPDGTQASFVVEAKSTVEPKTAQEVAARFRSRGTNGLVVAQFLTSRAQEILRGADINYADITGNVYIRSSHPAIFIDARGADRNPHQKRKIRTLKGPKAGRIVRVLCDWKGPFKIGEIAKLAHTDVGYTSRIVDVLDQDALIQRLPRGPVLSADWKALIRRLASEYSLLQSNRTEAFLDPRGLSAFEDKLRKTDLPYLLTGSIAAYKIAPVAPPRLATCYVQHIEDFAKAFALRHTEVGANVVLLEPGDPLRYFHSWPNDGLKLAGLSQIAADLLTGPGRSPQEGEELLRWMEENEEEWRRAAP